MKDLARAVFTFRSWRFGAQRVMALRVILAACLALVLEVRADGPPINDQFTNRIHLAGVPVSTTGSNIAATRSPDDPWVGGEGAYATVWWNWVAPSNGLYAVVVGMTNAGRPLLSVYTHASGYWYVPAGLPGESYQILRDGTPCRAMQVLLSATADTEYEIVVDARDSVSNDLYQGTFSLAITVPPTLLFLAPAEAAEYPSGVDVPLRTDVADVDGQVRRVDYSLRFGSNIASVAEVPWEAVWTNVPAGRYSLAASATDELGARTSIYRELAVGRPPNDDFADRFPLTGVPALASGTTVAAGKEPLESNAVGCYTSSQSVWWTWTAPSNGEYAVVVAATNFPQIVGVYSGSQVEALYLLAYDSLSHSDRLPDGGYTYYSQATFQALGGTNYQIVVEGGGRPSDFTLAVTVPPRGHFTNPAPRAVFPELQPILLSVEPNDDDGAIQRVDLFRLALGPGYSQSYPIGTVTQPPWSFWWSNPPAASYPVCARIVDNVGAECRVSNLLWVGVSPPVNDDFAASLVIPNSSASVTVSGSNQWASAEPGEPSPGPSVWWSWTAPATELATIQVRGGAAFPAYAIYVGGAISDLRWLVYSSGGPFSFTAAAGTTYHFQVTAGPCDLELSLATAPLPPARLTPLGFEFDGCFRLSYSGVDGQRSVVEASDDLRSWTPISTNDSFGGTTWVYDYGATNWSQRFYRLRHLPFLP